jgi:hypothetical protein
MRLSPLVLLPLIPAALGCAGTVSGSDAVDAEASAKTSALVAIERTTDSTQGSRAEASARFLRVTAPGSSDDAMRAIGAALDLPAVGTCAALSTRAGSLSIGPDLQRERLVPVVELLDVGSVSLEAAGVETRLSPRQLPDVTDVVNGVVYSRATDPLLLPPGARYVVRVAGGPGFDPIEVSALAPADPADLRIAGETPEGSGTLTASGSSVDISWTARPDDVVYVDVRPSGARCALGDGGTGSVSTLLLDDEGTLIIHRLHREALRARGIDSGEVRFDFARTVGYVRSAR